MGSTWLFLVERDRPDIFLDDDEVDVPLSLDVLMDLEARLEELEEDMLTIPAVSGTELERHHSVLLPHGFPLVMFLMCL